jgi:phenylalanyl-tRNA synthetase beta chain
VTLRASRLNQLLGKEIPFDEAVSSLERLGFALRERSADQATFLGASHRPDVSIEVDLVEEVARLRGLDEIPIVLPRILPQPPRKTGLLERETVAAGVSLGLSEALTYAFVSETDLSAVKAPPPVVRLKNPLSEDRNVQRTSLLPGLLDAVRRARRRGEQRATLFTVGAVYLPPAATQSPQASDARPRLAPDLEELPEERPAFAAVLSGQRREYLSLKPSEFDVFDAKGVAEGIVKRLTGRNASVEHVGATAKTQHLHPRGAATISVDGRRVGHLGPIHPNVSEQLEIDASVQIVEIDLAELEQIGKRVPKFKPIPKLPAVTRDLSLVLPESVSAGSVREAVANAAGELCEDVELTSVFRGGSVPEGHVSLTFHLVYRDPKSTTDADNARTLTDKEVDRQQAQVLERTKSEFGATLRG